MSQHNTDIGPVPSLVLHEPPRRAQNDLEARVILASIVGDAFERVPPSYIVRGPVERSLRCVQGWRAPELVNGFRVHDLLLTPQPFARIVLRGLTAHIAGAPPPDGPSRRTSLAALLARVASLLLVADQDDVKNLSDEALSERRRTVDEMIHRLEAERAKCDSEAQNRRMSKIAGQHG